ncbi:MAG: hypothetical protein WC621_00875 [Patescibacteria group bacterium]
MAVPYYIFLLIYLLIAVALLLYGASILWHLLRYGFLSWGSVFLTFIMIAGTVVVLFISYRTLAPVDWNQSFDLFGFIFNLNPLR